MNRILFFILIASLGILYILFANESYEGFGNGIVGSCTIDQVGKMVQGGYCVDASYVDLDNKSMVIPGKYVISTDHYIDSNGVIQRVPYGFMRDLTDPTCKKLGPLTKNKSIDISSGIQDVSNGMVYGNYTANLDLYTVYHDEYIDASGNPTGIIAPDSGGLPAGQMYVQDPNTRTIGPVSIFDPSFDNPLYYQAGSMKYPPKNYVPTYEDSVYLSNLSNFTLLENPNGVKPILQSGSVGFCAGTIDVIEKGCKSTPLENCASTTCCTLLAGEKCVAGNQYGPVNPPSDVLMNRDFYYYRGKCYGFCP
jgi:hypothetical protein